MLSGRLGTLESIFWIAKNLERTTPKLGLARDIITKDNPLVTLGENNW